MNAEGGMRKSEFGLKHRQDADATTREHGIIMSGDNPRLILAGLKTQTRRLPCVTNSLVDGVHWSAKDFARLDFDSPKVFVDHGPSPAGNAGPYLHVPNKDGELWHRVYPIWFVGDLLWVREVMWLAHRDDVGPFLRFNDGTKAGTERLLNNAEYKWTMQRKQRGTIPSIHMPKWAARIWRKVLKVRIERVQEMSRRDAEAEGMKCRHCKGYTDNRTGCTCIKQYANRWDLLHGNGSWDENRWVFALDF